MHCDYVILHLDCMLQHVWIVIGRSKVQGYGHILMLLGGVFTGVCMLPLIDVTIVLGNDANTPITTKVAESR